MIMLMHACIQCPIYHASMQLLRDMQNPCMSALMLFTASDMRARIYISDVITVRLYD